jgi:hypothetical protein
VKRLVRVVVVLAVLAVAVDFGAKLLVENLAARAVSSRRGVNGSVDVSFGGFPFLLALKDRHFGDVTIEAADVRSGGFMTSSAPSPGTETRMESVRLELEDVDVTGQVWRDDGGGRVSATSGGGAVVLSQNALNKIVPPEYSARLTLRQGSLHVEAESQFGAHEAEVAEEDVRLEAGPGSGTLVVEAAAPLGAITIPLPTLVDGVAFEGFDVRRGELELTFSVQDVSLEL